MSAAPDRNERARRGEQGFARIAQSFSDLELRPPVLRLPQQIRRPR